MIKTILKINLFIVLLALQGCAYEYCCADGMSYLNNEENNQNLYEISDCYRFRVSCEVMCGGDCYGGPTD